VKRAHAGIGAFGGGDMIALMYHDLIVEGSAANSGFPGRDAQRYKISLDRFRRHLEAFARAPFSMPVLTFDDGGASAMTAAAELESRGLRAYFFITTGYIGCAGFLTAPQIRELAARGHVIGSHSSSHPLQMSRLPWTRLREEWTTSRDVLSEIVGGAVTSSSLPGGDFAEPVAIAAAAAGYAQIFTSEPRHRSTRVAGLTVNGRFTIRRWTSATTACAAAHGAWIPWTSQAFLWNAKKIAKRFGGEHYFRARKLLLRHGNEVPWGDRR
jgi:peptidoglycan/xylan/chitin deacetylase (PgdA/CDA1 family)